jgi:hypothetical protein
MGVASILRPDGDRHHVIGVEREQEVRIDREVVDDLTIAAAETW